MPDDDFRLFDPIDPRDTSPGGTGFERLQRDGVQVRAPGDVSPDQIRGCLWELIYALAAHHVFLLHTNHLDDAELYAWLHDEWLARSSSAVPGTRWNEHIDILGTGTDADNEIWLRFYADEVFREIWSRDFPEDLPPPSEAAPFDRDRWLPGPTMPAATEPEEPGLPPRQDGLAGTSFDDLHDPLQLEAVDREIHEAAPGFEGDDSENELNDTYGDADSADSSEELLREPAVGVETDRWRNPHAELMASGVILPPPEELTDEALPAKLWELFHELACRGFYLLHTDHLGDRELYTKLWRENLHEPAILPGPSSGGGWYHDFIGSGRTEEVFHWLRYYANDLEREKYALQNPNQTLPPREQCPFRRDRRLPKGPF
jgi:hypothetical protein